MPLVRMIITMSGTRADNRSWPPYHGEIEVSDWEAKALVKGHHAEYVDVPILDRGWDMLKVPDPEIEEKLRWKKEYGPTVDYDKQDVDTEVVMDDEYDEDFDRRDDDSDFDRDEVELPKSKPMKRPVTTDTKAEWVKWAVQNGAEEKQALEITKAQLVAKYGKL